MPWYFWLAAGVLGGVLSAIILMMWWGSDIKFGPFK